nr:hypothetical protein [Candidatus Enterovibrio escacola]
MQSALVSRSLILLSYRLVIIYVFHGIAGLRRWLNEVKVTTTNVDDKKPMPDMTDNLWGSISSRMNGRTGNQR